MPVTPDLPTSAVATEWLERHGHRPGYGWMKFIRDGGPPEWPETPEPEIAELGAGEGEAFGTIVAEGFGLPPWAASLFRDLPGRRDWRCYVALVDGTPAASAAMVIEDGVAEFGLAATLPRHGAGAANLPFFDAGSATSPVPAAPPSSSRPANAGPIALPPAIATSSGRD